MWHDARVNGPDGRDFGEGSRTTYLAAERTYLSWIRSGLAALAVAVGVGRLIPALLKTDQPVFALLGAGYGCLGLWMIAYGGLRQRATRRAIEQGRFPFLSDRVVMGLTVVGTLLGIATVVVVLMEL